MSIRRDAADALLERARRQPGDSYLGNQGGRPLEAPTEVAEAQPPGPHDATSFAYVWQLFGYAILDNAGTKIGSVARIWTDTASGRLTFVGLTTGRLRRQTRVIPAGDACIDDHTRSMQVPCRAATILSAPHHNSDVGLKSDQERKVVTHYDNC